MASFFEQLRKQWPSVRDEDSPPVVADYFAYTPEEERQLQKRRWKDYPKTSVPELLYGTDEAQAKIFDPAVKHYANAFRLCDPASEDAEAAAQWCAARLRVMHHLLRIVSASRWKEHLVLRGSMLMSAWFGMEAREPGDIDWVVTPAEIEFSDPLAHELLEDLVRLVSEQPQVGNATITASDIAIDEIWTYERVPGKRIAFPWAVEGLPPGVVQMDLVYGEELPSKPVSADIPTPDGEPISLWAATPELSLAWKLLWLETDNYPQGKDLYDATLLAERTSLRLDLLERVFRAAGYPLERESKPRLAYAEYVDWENFVQEYPWVVGSEEEWRTRLLTALGPTFRVKQANISGRSDPKAGPYFQAPQTERVPVFLVVQVPADLSAATGKKQASGGLDCLPISNIRDGASHWTSVESPRKGSRATLRRVLTAKNGRRCEIILLDWT